MGSDQLSDCSDICNDFPTIYPVFAKLVQLICRGLYLLDTDTAMKQKSFVYQWIGLENEMHK